MHHYDRQTRDIHARLGESFVVVLPSLPGAGFAWRSGPETGIVRLASHSIQPATKAVGASALDEFVFEAVREGTTDLEFHYGRPWEKSPAETWRVPVTVEVKSKDRPGK
ncbi:MAG: protease inhibitor I42 family protein [Planctomycetaceae bacterium]|nr:protease inhibitor I42 family protein [Planctomycetaceae bacterium]